MTTFMDCLLLCAETPELLVEYDRLQGTRLASLHRRTPLDRAIDEATGKEREDVLAFADFVFACIYLPYVAERLAVRRDP